MVSGRYRLGYSIRDYDRGTSLVKEIEIPVSDDKPRIRVRRSLEGVKITSGIIQKEGRCETLHIILNHSF